MANTGAYHLWGTKGSGARIALENETITEIGGKIPIRLDKDGTAFIQGKVDGLKADHKKHVADLNAHIKEAFGRLGVQNRGEAVSNYSVARKLAARLHGEAALAHLQPNPD